MFRADAHANMGIGHVMRCLTLANILSDHGVQCHFFHKKSHSKIFKLISDRHNVVELDYENGFTAQNEYQNWLGSSQEWDVNQCIKKSKINKYDFIVVDNYALDEKWEEDISTLSENVMVFDDLANRNHSCQLLVDSGLFNSYEDYVDLTKDRTKIFTGSDYVVLRPEFLKARSTIENSNIIINPILKILVNFGGTDPDKLTLIALDALSHINPKLHVDVIITSSCDWLDELKACIKQSEYTYLHIDPQSVSEVMLEADFAIASIGGGAWERCCLGLAGIGVVVAENQKGMAQTLENSNALIVANKKNLGTTIIKTLNSGDISNTVKAMSHSAFSLCDGLGVYRVLAALSKKLIVTELRALTKDDAALLFEWQNEPTSRRYSLSSEPLNWNEHCSWLDKSLSSPERRMWVVTFEDMSCGYVRLDDLGESEIVSILISSKFRRLGLAGKAIQLLKEKSKQGLLAAKVLDSNQASNALFLAQGFKKIAHEYYSWCK